MNFPNKVPCIKSIQAGKFCWLEAVGSTTPDADLQDNILLCKECSTFRDLLGRGFGRRKADLALGETVADLLKLVADRNESLTNAQQRLERLLEEMVLLKTITDSLVKTRDLHRALRIILTGVTSGRAFEFNRAGIFLVDKRNEYLTGEYAIGPGNHAQAREIWDRISLTTFQDQIRAIIDIADLEHDSLREIIQTIKIPLSDKNNVFVKALWADKAIFYKRSDLDKSMVDRILKFTDFNEFVIIPLRTENQPVGILLADNYFTGKPITDSSILALETLANTCSSFLENTLLHRELSDRLKELEHVNKLLRENQNYLVQTQRLADIGKIATAVAHEIKTPLATIGGYAHRALKILNQINSISMIWKLSYQRQKGLKASRPSCWNIPNR